MDWKSDWGYGQPCGAEELEDAADRKKRLREEH